MVTTSKVLDVNLGCIVKNYSLDFIRDNYDNLNDFISTTADRYASMIGIDKDMTKAQIVDKLRIAFISPVNVLKRQINRERAICQFADVIEEYKEAIIFYNNQ